MSKYSPQMKDSFVLYGASCSLYSAKARSYMRKQNIDFVELAPNHPRFKSHILPEIGRWIIPVLETPNGMIVQDSSDIIDYFDKSELPTSSVLPDGSILQCICYLLELFGGEGLLRPAMHYRWNFDSENLNFLKSEFSHFVPLGKSRTEIDKSFSYSSGKMREATDFFGVNSETSGLVEESFREFLALLEHHLSEYQYLLGDSPSLADYSFMGPLYGHLFRDPVPSQIMRKSAPTVARWIERMNTHEEYLGDHPKIHGFKSDTIPDSLSAILIYLAKEYKAELIAHIEFTNEWLSNNPEVASGSNGLDPASTRSIGLAEFDWRGKRIGTAVMLYRFYLLQKLQDCFDQCKSGDQNIIKSLFAAHDLSEVLENRVARRVIRKNHFEVWD